MVEIDEKLAAYRIVYVTHLPTSGTPCSEDSGYHIWTD